MRRTSWFIAASLSAILATQASWLLAAEGPPQGAKVLFYTETGTTVDPKIDSRTPPAPPDPIKKKLPKEPWLGIAYWVEWERPGASPTRIAGPSRFVFQSEDRVRFHVKTNTEGYLYVINRGSSGRDTLLFPHAGMADQQNRVEARKEYSVPHRGWIRFDDQPGEEVLLFLLSPRLQKKILDAFLPRPALSPPASGRLLEAVDRRGAKDLLVETDETPGQQATYAGAAIRPTSGDPEEGTIITYRTRLQHQ